MIRYNHRKKEQAVIDLCSRSGTAESVASAYGIDRVTLYEWNKKYNPMKEKTKMIKKKASVTQNENDVEYLQDKLAFLQKEVESQEKMRAELEREVYRLRLERDILEAAEEVLKKDKGIDINKISNREKAMVINALREKYRLNILLDAVNISKSSYCYQNNALKRPDKYQNIRESIKSTFRSGYHSYGYRRIYLALKNNGITVSEKIIRRIMKQENLVVYCKRRKKYSSYVGEISPAVPDLVQRNFHADRPNELWLTDITEFRIPAGKIYLSPIIDCFDGLPVSWTIGTSPNAKLVNTMLDTAIRTLTEKEHPVVHSDR